MAVNNGRSVITLDHDRGGKAALVVRLTASCDRDLAGAREVASEQRGARRYYHTAPGFSTRFYVFPGAVPPSASARQRPVQRG